ncbi:RHS repeat-associated core domain-containing protein [Flavobacterium sp. JP2137]|uniref:RHS repeat domain-containing protein n=1 Tax=Flavobacterium sp. JP2137 TaxID=3414510 RepID=UPI003D2FFD41
MLGASLLLNTKTLNHLGSSSYLTDVNGMPTHYYEYLPFGEMMVEHNNSNFDNIYKFNAKELDEQTGYYYYGARYYNPRTSVFLSVDPLAEQTMEPYLYTGNNPIMFTDPTGMSKEGGEDHWEIKNGKAYLIDTVGDDILVRNEGDKDYKLLSEFDFTKRMDAAKDIVSYYSSDYSLSSVNGGSFELEPSYFKNTRNAEKAGFSKGTQMWVRLQFNSGGLFSSDKVDISGKFMLIDGKFDFMLNNKYNMQNTIGHEYRHFLDDLGVRSKVNYGFNYGELIKSNFLDKQNLEQRAIQYQRQLPSWNNTTNNYKRAMEYYYDLNSK